MKKIFRDQIWAKIGQNRSQKCFLSSRGKIREKKIGQKQARI